MQNNYAFIDSQNLNLGVRGLGWQLDFKRFRIYLEQKFRVKKAFLFIGYIPSNKNLYSHLKKAGYLLIFKQTIKTQGSTKGNVDAELVLNTMHELCKKSFDKAIIVTGDGDFQCLVKYLKTRNKLAALVVPNKHRYSSLLRKFSSHIDFLNKKEKKLCQKKREA